VKFDMMQTL